MAVTKAIVKSGQSLYDIALQETGGVKGALQIAKLNNISVTDLLAPNQVILIDSEIVSNQKIVDYLKNNYITPVSF